MSEYLTPPQVAKRLHVSPEKVRHWITSGKLAAVNVGNGELRPRFRVSPESLEAFTLARTPMGRPAVVRRPRRKLKYL